MKRIISVFVFLLLVSCQSEIKKEDLSKLNGYWEIKEVEMPSGEKKDYKVNETIDYFQVKNDVGFRQKVMPRFDGKFGTNDIKEELKIIEKDAHFFIEFKTNYGKWQEEIITLEDSTLVLKNKEELIYEYKRHIPFSLK
ncbi:MAG: hypothetical protein O9282_09465 [Flavobacterium sp.]|jgi:hypothetical protein|uniref:lipocalin family protein n=1 Tax=Flavobacterium sp. TaxID=239 RepID=UPI0022C88DB4|nr:lipocalin family protein [Flavobacterium sp.]MCZ8090267.1 hypothetical protein [Flavobacterium sp.]MCZ8331526.1 hypothetical protein [Flavobacterium sp.]